MTGAAARSWDSLVPMPKRPFSVADRRRSVADLPDFTQPANGGPSVATRRVVPTAVPPGIEPQLPPFRPVTPRRKLLIVALTLATVVGLAVLMLEPHRLLTAAKEIGRASWRERV